MEKYVDVDDLLQFRTDNQREMSNASATASASALSALRAIPFILYSDQLTGLESPLSSTRRNRNPNCDANSWFPANEESLNVSRRIELISNFFRIWLVIGASRTCMTVQLICRMWLLQNVSSMTFERNPEQAHMSGLIIGIHLNLCRDWRNSSNMAS